MDVQDQFKSLDSKIEDIKSVVLDINKYVVEGFKVVDANFEAIEKRLDALDEKIETLAKMSSKEFESVGGQLNDLKVEVNKIQKVSNYSAEYENLLKISR